MTVGDIDIGDAMVSERQSDAQIKKIWGQ